MFSNLNCNTPPCDIPYSPAVHPNEDPTPLNFDDLLDIAHEFEFTRTITHIWPCEEPSTYPEIGLDDIFGTITPTLNAEESPMPLPSSTLLVPLDPVQEVNLHRSVLMPPLPAVNTGVSKDPGSLLLHEDQIRVECPITSTLEGWSPPDGTQFLDLDDSLMFPRSGQNMWISPWLATFLASSCTQPARSIGESSTTVHATGDLPITSATDPKVLPVNTSNMTADDPRRKTVPLRAQCSIFEPLRTGSSPQANANIPSQVVISPRVKTLKPRVHPPATPAMGGPSVAKYAKAPRGGIPPHIARTVTKANILRIQKERKVMQDALSSTTTAERKKPSVLRRAVRDEKECGGNGQKAFDRSDEKQGRAAKRARA